MALSETTFSVNGVRLHCLIGGRGPAAVLLHGWPQTCAMWRSLAETLSSTHTVIAPDLRGYGRSDKPVRGYDKRTMARDVRALLAELGMDRCDLVGHDRGARVAHRFCLDHGELVRRAVFMDIIPTRALFAQADVAVARGFWHWLFHTQPDAPEMLLEGRVGPYLRFFFERWTHNRAAFDEETIAAYVSAYEAPGALRGFLDDYRATFRGDLEADEESFAAGKRVPVPCLVLWGEHGLVGSLPVLDIWREYAGDVRGRAIPGCGHFLVEEAPEEVAREVTAFLGTR